MSSSLGVPLKLHKIKVWLYIDGYNFKLVLLEINQDFIHEEKYRRFKLPIDPHFRPVPIFIEKTKQFANWVNWILLKAPANDSTEVEKNQFYYRLKAVIEEVPFHDMLMVMG